MAENWGSGGGGVSKFQIVSQQKVLHKLGLMDTDFVLNERLHANTSSCSIYEEKINKKRSGELTNLQ